MNKSELIELVEKKIAEQRNFVKEVEPISTAQHAICNQAIMQYSWFIEKLKILNVDIRESDDSVCPQCGYPTFKKSFEDFERCHGCTWTSKQNWERT